jgi:hypothetical protein
VPSLVSLVSSASRSEFVQALEGPASMRLVPRLAVRVWVTLWWRCIGLFLETST